MLDSREVIKILKRDGWYEVTQVGRHKQFKHPVKKGRGRCLIRKERFRWERLRALRNTQVSGCGDPGCRPRNRVMEYIVYLHKDRKSDYGVSFPDFPGCVTSGKTLDQARRMATEALSLHIEGMAEDGEPIPEPSTLDDVAADPAMTGAVAFLVSVGLDKTVRLNITARESQVAAIDQKAE